MSTLKVYSQSGAEDGDLEFSDNLLVLDRGQQAVQDVIVALQAGRRAGTADTLRKSEVAGSGRKPWRQKGSGRARSGYRQSPVWRGGAVAHGPHPRSYAKKVNKKVAALAFRRAFSDKVAAGEVRVVRDMAMEEPKTKRFAGLLKGLGIAPPALFILGNVDETVARASRNLPRVEVVSAKDANVYQLLRYPNVVVDEAGLSVIKGRLGASPEGAE